MYNYDIKQMSESNRYFNNITACKIIKIDDGFGLEFELSWGETCRIRPKDFEIAGYEVGEWIDVILGTVTSANTISLKSAQFIGRTPEKFIPKD